MADFFVVVHYLFTYFYIFLLPFVICLFTVLIIWLGFLGLNVTMTGKLKELKILSSHFSFSPLYPHIYPIFVRDFYCSMPSKMKIKILNFHAVINLLHSEQIWTSHSKNLKNWSLISQVPHKLNLAKGKVRSIWLC